MRETIWYVGHLIQSLYDLQENPSSVPDGCHILNIVLCLQKAISSLYQGFRMLGNWIPELWVHCCASLTVKWVPWSEAIVYEISWPWRRYSASPWLMVLAEVCKCKKVKSITRISIYTCKSEALSFPQKKCSSVVSLLSITGWPTWRTGPCLGLSLCSWQIWHSAAAIATSALMSSSPCRWANA